MQESPWDALGDPTRRMLFERLVERPLAVNELASGLPISRPAVSQHLRVLKDAGLVSDRAEGRRRIYAVDSAGLAALRRDLDRFWTHALGAFKAAVERSEKEKETS
jgi:DNA-binding transcriptional ArsR family regulator